MEPKAGTLYVVATPIGNLDDLSDRARAVLAAADLVAAEDTRRTGQMLTRLGIRAPLRSLHEHNEAGRTPELLARLAGGASIALVSDAGTPLVSDPGYRLVAAARAAGLRVSPVPGCSAAIAALSVAGLPTDRFTFEGFLPPRPAARRRRLAELAGRAETLVFYEAPARVRATLADLIDAFGPDRRATFCRELTKLHEATYHGPLQVLAAQLDADPGSAKGEFTLVVAGCADTPTEADTSGQTLGDPKRVMAILAESLPRAEAARLTARLTGMPRRDAYRLQQTGRTDD